MANAWLLAVRARTMLGYWQLLETFFMNLFIDNNDGRGLQDYTAWVDAGHLPKIARKLNRAATMTASLINCGPSFARRWRARALSYSVGVG